MQVRAIPLVILAAGAILLSLLGTPLWPWFHAYINGHAHAESVSRIDGSIFVVMLISTLIVAIGISTAWWLYNRHPSQSATEADALERVQPDVFFLLRNKFFVDELYEATVVRVNASFARLVDLMDRFVWDSLVFAIGYLFVGVSWINRLIDELVVNPGFDKGCGAFRRGGQFLSFWQNGQVQRYLRFIGLAAAVFVLVLIWGCRA